MEDPYAPPSERPIQPRRDASTSIGSALLVVAASTLCLGASGMLGGLAIGAMMPAYYRGVFSAEVDPIQVGLGLGLTQGAGVGAIVGAIVASGAMIGRGRRRELRQLRDDLDGLRAELDRLGDRLDRL